MHCSRRPCLALSAATALAIGCGETITTPSESSTDTPSGETTLAASDGRSSSSLNQDLAALRRATVGFHDFAAAQAAEYVKITDCLENPPLGGQGFHYGNHDLIENGEVDLLEPELLLYEPHGGGSLRFVGVEYIVPIDLWTGASPPTLLGEEFHEDVGLNLYVLHVWLWRHNPSGLFADWNPKVSCTHPSN